MGLGLSLFLIQFYFFPANYCNVDLVLLCQYLTLPKMALTLTFSGKLNNAKRHNSCAICCFH